MNFLDDITTLFTTAAKVAQAEIKSQGYTSEPHRKLSAAGSPLTFYPALLLVAYVMIKAVSFIAVKKRKLNSASSSG